MNIILKIKSPEYELKFLKNFPLSQLEKKFSIAEFERPLKVRHVTKIVDAMKINEFFDNILGVYIKRNGQYQIFDGQHRIESLGILRDEYGVKHYDLVLMIFPERLARTIYRRINLGVRLTMKEHLAAMDNGQRPFFISLHEYYVHYNSGKVPRYDMVLNALHYAKNGSPRAVRPLLLDRMFQNIRAIDIKTIITFSRALSKIDPIKNKKKFSMLYRYSVYRNVFRVGYENSFTQLQWEQFITLCKTDPVITSLYGLRQQVTVMKRIYSYMIEELGLKMNITLNKVERTPSQSRLVLNTGGGPPLMNY